MNPNGLQKCSPFLGNAGNSNQRYCTFFHDIWIIELTHIVFELGHLNPINIFKCSNNSETSFGLLGTIPKEPTIIFRIFENVLVFLIKPNSCRKIRKQKTN